MGDTSQPNVMISEATRKLKLEALRISDPSHEEEANLKARLNALRSTGHDSHYMKYQSSEVMKQPVNLQDIITKMKDKPNGYEEFHCEEMSLPPVNVPTAYKDLKKKSLDARDQFVQTQPQIAKTVDIRDQFVQTQPQIPKKVDFRDQSVQTEAEIFDRAKVISNNTCFLYFRLFLALCISVLCLPQGKAVDK